MFFSKGWKPVAPAGLLFSKVWNFSESFFQPLENPINLVGFWVVTYPLWVYKADMKENTTTHKETLNRLSRIAGQVAGVKRMVEEEKYCIDIVTQIQAARSALRSVEMKILEKHMQHCVSDAFESGKKKEADEKMDELLRVMKKQF